MIEFEFEFCWDFIYFIVIYCSYKKKSKKNWRFLYLFELFNFIDFLS